MAKIPLSEYDKNQSTWNEKKATMITKVAKVQALRDAFPAQLGAMYTSEEQGVIDIEATEVTPRKVIDTKITQQEEPTEQEETTAEIDFSKV